MALILASASPRRKELMSFITDDFIIRVSDADETIKEVLSPEETVIHLARIKGRAVSNDNPDNTVISADTVVSYGEKILGKPHSEKEAFEMLSSLSGKTHTVFTGVCIISGEKEIVFAEKTDVTFYELSDTEINKYIASGEPFDKAGAYGIQGKAALFVKGIEGDYFNVMGFPIARLNRTLTENGIL